MQIALYKVRFFDPQTKTWFDGTTPLPYTACKVAALFYAQSFHTTIVYAGIKQ